MNKDAFPIGFENLGSLSPRSGRPRPDSSAEIVRAVAGGGQYAALILTILAGPASLLCFWSSPNAALPSFDYRSAPGPGSPSSVEGPAVAPRRRRVVPKKLESARVRGGDGEARLRVSRSDGRWAPAARDVLEAGARRSENLPAARTLATRKRHDRVRPFSIGPRKNVRRGRLGRRRMGPGGARRPGNLKDSLNSVAGRRGSRVLRRRGLPRRGTARRALGGVRTSARLSGYGRAFRATPPALGQPAADWTSEGVTGTAGAPATGEGIDPDGERTVEKSSGILDEPASSSDAQVDEPVPQYEDSPKGGEPAEPGPESPPQAEGIAGTAAEDGYISIDSDPPGAEVYYRYNGGEWTDTGEKTASTFTGVPEGSYEIGLAKECREFWTGGPGYYTPGMRLDLRPELEKQPVLTIRTTPPGAAIYYSYEGEAWADSETTTEFSGCVPAGTYEMLLVLPGYEEVRFGPGKLGPGEDVVVEHSFVPLAS